jgi:hypothetical protein
MTNASNTVQSPPRGTHRLRLAPHEVRELGRYLSVIVARVRAAMTDERGPLPTEKLTIDLAGAPTAPGAQLVLLVKLLRRNLGDGVVIELTGVAPAIRTSLVAFGIPRDVAVIDTSGRSWAG